MILQMKIRQIEVGDIMVEPQRLAPGCIGVLVVFDSEESARAFDPDSDLVPIRSKAPLLKVCTGD